MKIQLVTRRLGLVLVMAATLATAVCARLATANDASIAPREELALTVYTYKTPGICPACDATRPVTTRLARERRVDFVYRDTTAGLARSRADGVELFPTFVVARRSRDGAWLELARWSGSRDLERRLARFGFALGDATAPIR